MTLISRGSRLDKKAISSSNDDPKIFIVGSPNVGKSVIFNSLTGRYVVVSNYPGTTVEVSRGTGKIADIIWDSGSIGKEPMMRLFSKDSKDMVAKLGIIKELLFSL